jgi:DNA-binding Xre family transcriptional regulator
MNTGKAIKVALAMREMNQNDLASKLGMTAPATSQMCSRKSASIAMLSKVAKALDMKVSELMALGE